MASFSPSITKNHFDGWSPNLNGYKRFRLPVEEDFKNVTTILSEKGLALTQPIKSNYSFRGCCQGGAFSVIALYLEGYRFSQKSAFKDAYYQNLNTIILIQKIQKQLFGVFKLSSSQKIDFFRHFFQTHCISDSNSKIPSSLIKDPAWSVIYQCVWDRCKSSERTTFLRRDILISLQEKGIVLTPKLYENIVEIVSWYDFYFFNSTMRYHNLEKDILVIIGKIAGVQLTEIAAFAGKMQQLIDNLKLLPTGVYHLGLPNHSIVYIKESEIQSYLWDINKGVVTIPLGSGEEHMLKKNLKPWLRHQVNWVTIYSCKAYYP